MCQLCVGGLIKRYNDECSECSEHEGLHTLGAAIGVPLVASLVGWGLWRAYLKFHGLSVKEGRYLLRVGYLRRMTNFRTL